MLKNYDYSPLCYCLMHAMVQPALETEWVPMQACAASVPHHNQVLRLDLGLLDLAMWLHEEDTWLRWSDSLCGAKTAGLILKCKPCSPGRKDHWTGEFGVITHHGGRCSDGHSYHVGVISIPPTNITAIDEYVNMWARSETCQATSWWS